MDHQPHGRVDRQSHAIRNTVGDVKELDLERPDREPISAAHRVKGHSIEQVMPLQLDLGHAARQLRRIDRCVDLGHEVAQGADVILVPVCQEDGPDLILLVQQVSEIGDHQVDAQHVALWEHQPAVDDDDLLVVFQDHHILAHLAEPAEGEDAQSLVGQCPSTPLHPSGSPSEASSCSRSRSRNARSSSLSGAFSSRSGRRR